MDALLSPAGLAQALGRDHPPRVLDCTWFLPGEGDARAAYDAAHIPRAGFLDLAAFARAGDPRPMMLPPRDEAAALLAAAGIGDGTRVVLYDGSPHHTAARGWAMLRSYGIADVALLDGGLAAWRAAGLPLSDEPVAPRPAPVAIDRDSIGIADKAAVALALADGAQVVDARSPSRFAGAEPEPREGVVPGHMPGAVNIHYARFFAPDGRWKRGAALAAVFADAGIDPARPTIATCGSGVTAAIVAFAAHLLGHDVAVYDGSWAEWGADPATPKATGR